MTYSPASNLPRGRDANVPADVNELREHPAVQAIYAGMTLSEAASAYGVKKPTLAQWLGKVRGVYGDVGLPENFLRRSRALREKDSKTVHTYPVYGKVRVGLSGQTSMVEPVDGDGRSYYTDRDLRAGEAGAPFALQVEGGSMTDDRASTQFPDGAVVLVNPNREPISGDFVVAIDRTDGSTTFKRLRRMGAETYLVPLNDTYQPIPLSDDLFIAGVVEEAILPCYSRR